MKRVGNIYEKITKKENIRKAIINASKGKKDRNGVRKILEDVNFYVDEIYNIQNIIIENFEQEEKGYFLPFKKETYLRILNDPINDGEIYGTFIDNKMIAWIFLSVSNRMKELKQMIPNLNGSCADIDGVVVLPKYRGYGLQKTLVKYLEERAREKGISNIIAEVTFGNVYSLRNLKDLGYEEQTWYQKDKNIKRYILLKKLGETENG